jgi:hypothetical protein
MEIKADLKDYKRGTKYYGTVINVNLVGLEHQTIELWDYGDGIPSRREFENHGMTREQWENNDLIGGERAKDILPAADHFESNSTLLLAELIVEAINRKGKL